MNKEQYKELELLRQKYCPLYEIYLQDKDYWFSPSSIVGKYIVDNQQKCQHNYKLSYYDWEGYNYVGFWDEPKSKVEKMLYFQDELECQNCGKIIARRREYDNCKREKKYIPIFYRAWRYTMEDMGSRYFSSVPRELIWEI